MDQTSTVNLSTASSSADMIRMKCPACGRQLELDAGFAGSVCRCSLCGALVTVPESLGAGNHGTAVGARPDAPPVRTDSPPRSPGSSHHPSDARLSPNSISSPVRGSPQRPSPYRASPNPGLSPVRNGGEQSPAAQADSPLAQMLALDAEDPIAKFAAARLGGGKLASAASANDSIASGKLFLVMAIAALVLGVLVFAVIAAL